MTHILPDRGYVICSEHRSGTTLLCQLLRSTGVLGKPDEFFRDTLDSMRIEREPALMDTILAEATTANGVYGLKVFSQQFDNTIAARWAERLPNLRHVHVERRDLLGQAISLVRALQTNQYEASQSARGEPRYDREAIARHLGRIAEGHARWRCYFARNGLRPAWLTYEEIVADPLAAVNEVAALVGVGPIAELAQAQVEVRIQRDEVSEAWRDRFVAESRDLNYLDHRFGRPRVWLRRLARDALHLRHRAARRK